MLHIGGEGVVQVSYREKLWEETNSSMVAKEKAGERNVHR